MPTEKGISFGFKVSESDLARMKQAIKEITGELGKLQSAAAEASKAFGGMFGGVNVSGGAKAGGTGGGASTAAKLAGTAGGGAGAAGGGASKSLTQVFQENANAFRNLATSSKDSMRMMADGLKSSIAEQRAALESLNSKLADTTSKYQRLSSSPAGQTPVGQRAMRGMEAQAMGYSGEIAKLNGNVSRGQDQQQAVQQGLLGNPSGGLAGQSVFGGSMKFGSFGMKAMGMAVAGATAIANEALYTNQNFENEEARMGAFKQMAYGVRRGTNMADAVMLMNAARREDYKNNAKSAGDVRVGGSAGSTVGMFTGGGNTGDVFGTTAEGTAKMHTLLDTVNRMKAASPAQTADLNEWTGSARSRYAMMNVLGIGTNAAWLKKAGGVGLNSMEEQSAAAASMMGHGVGFARANANQAVSLQHGNFNIGQWAQVKALSQIGGGSSLLSAMMGSAGKGGLDPTAAGNVGAHVAGIMQSAGGGYGMTGSSLYNLISQSGNSVGMAGQGIIGAQGLAGMMGGGQDAFGKGVGMRAAMNQVGSHSAYRTQMLSSMISDPAVIAAAFDPHGSLPSWATQAGITKDMVKNASTQSANTQIGARLFDQGGNTLMDQAVRGVKQGGIMGFGKSWIAGAKGKDKRARIEALGEAVAAANNDLTSEGINKGVRTVESMMGLGKGGKRGGGVGGAGDKSDTADQVRLQLEGPIKSMKETLAEFGDDLKKATLNAEALSHATASFGGMNQSADEAADAFSDVTDALKEFGGAVVSPEVLRKVQESREAVRAKRRDAAAYEQPVVF